MRVLLARQRGEYSYDEIKTAISESGFSITELISIYENDFDPLAEQWCAETKARPRIINENPMWNRVGRNADLKRKEWALESCDAVIVIWDGIEEKIRLLLNEIHKRGLKFSLKMRG